MTDPAPAKRRSLGRILRRPLVAIPVSWLVAVVIAAVIVPYLGLADPSAVDLNAVRSAPSVAHPLGADASGRDVLSRLLFGAQITLLAGLCATGVAMFIGAPLGLVAGYYGGRVDSVSKWVADLLQSLPSIVTLLALSVILGSNPIAIMTAFGVLLIPGTFGPVRTAVLAVRGELYIDAAKVAGVGDLSIMGRHVFRVVLPVALIQAGFIFGLSLIVQAGLEFIGIGEPGSPSWGGMLGDSFKEIFNAPWLIVPPAVTITATVLSLILLASEARDLLSDPETETGTRRERVPSADRSPAPALLDVRGLCVDYQVDGFPRRVVDGATFSVNRGEVLGLVGESGSGKTQTALAILRLLSPGGRLAEGSVYFDGQEITALSNSEVNAIRGSDIGYISQEPMSNLDPSFTVGAQLIEPIRTHLGMSKRAARVRALELLERVGIVDAKRTFHSFPHQISGGMAQRVLIAAAVSCNPKLLVADEPTTALDVTVQAEVLDLLRSLIRERDLAVILVTHDFGVVADICDRVIVMRNGAIVESAPVLEIFDRPQHEYARALLAATPAQLPSREHDPARIGSVLLEVDALTVSYHGRGRSAFQALSGVSLVVHEGETLGLVGESGSGKTTLGRTVLGLAPVTSGDIRWEGSSIAHLGRRERRALSSSIQVVFQDPYSSLNPAMAVEDILAEPLLLDRNIRRVEALARVRALLDAVHLPADAGRRFAREFSGGQRQRIAIARALCRSPRLIICDEPVSALDLSTQASVLDLFVEIQQRTGVAYLFISHDLDVVRHIADRTAVIQHGHLVEVGDSELIATNPHHEYTKRLAAASPVPDPRAQAARREARRAIAARPLPDGAQK